MIFSALDDLCIYNKQTWHTYTKNQQQSVGQIQFFSNKYLWLQVIDKFQKIMSLLSNFLYSNINIYFCKIYKNYRNAFLFYSFFHSKILIIIPIPIKIAKITRRAAPNNPHTPGDIANRTGPITTTKTIMIINPTIISKISSIILIHQHFVTSADLKHLWVSLSSKETFVFDTPGRDAHLHSLSHSVFYVCKLLNGEWLITDCHPYHSLSYVSTKTMSLFDGGGF